MNETNRRNGRRWFQVSLRSIFLLMLIVAAYFAGYHTAVLQAERAEQEARLQAEYDSRRQEVRMQLRWWAPRGGFSTSQIGFARALAKSRADADFQPELVQPRENDGH